MRYETLLLDFHGTFTSNKGRLAHSLNEAYVTVTGQKISKKDFQAVLDRPQKLSVQEALDTYINGSLPKEQKGQLIDVYQEALNRIYVPKYRPLLKTLHKMGATCVIVTNGEEQKVKDKIAEWNLSDCITKVYGKGKGSSLERIPRKPNPEVIDFIIDDLRNQGHIVDRGKTLMVGDYEDDIGAGNNSGLHTAFLVTGSNQLPEKYNVRPTYSLLDIPTNTKLVSQWLNRENVYQMSQLPKIVSGEL